jgi:hypothetical protein
MFINSFILFSSLCSSLVELEQLLDHELHLINYRTCPWKELSVPFDQDPVYDAIIIGDGLEAFAVGTALYKEGISKFKILGSNAPTPVPHKIFKTPSGSDIPALTFQAWYVAQYGLASWDEMKAVPNNIWKDYLAWYQRVMKLPVEPHSRLTALKPVDGSFVLEIDNQGKLFKIKTHRVVFADGKSLSECGEASKAYYYCDDDLKGKQAVTGGYHQPEIAHLKDQMDRWQHHLSPDALKANPEIGTYPYLGEHFEFRGSAPYLKDLYCFNEGALPSHGALPLSIGAERLAGEIAVDVFRRAYQDRKTIYDLKESHACRR